MNIFTHSTKISLGMKSLSICFLTAATTRSSSSTGSGGCRMSDVAADRHIHGRRGRGDVAAGRCSPNSTGWLVSTAGLAAAACARSRSFFRFFCMVRLFGPAVVFAFPSASVCSLDSLDALFSFQYVALKQDIVFAASTATSSVTRCGLVDLLCAPWCISRLAEMQPTLGSNAKMSWHLWPTATICDPVCARR